MFKHVFEREFYKKLAPTKIRTDQIDAAHEVALRTHRSGDRLLLLKCRSVRSDVLLSGVFAVRQGAIIVCGGRSSRMGTAKALLPFGPETMLERVVRIVREAIAGPIVVVAAPGQALPQLPADVTTTFDEREGRGPLEGLRAGLRAAAGRCDAVYAASCDVPLLRPEFVRYVCGVLGDCDAAVPQTGGFLHPLAAAYRTEAVLPHVEALLAADRLRPVYLFDLVSTRTMDEAELRTVDPSLNSLRNLNTPEDYRAALIEAGYA